LRQSVCLALSLVMQNATAAQQRDQALAQAVVAAGARLLGAPEGDGRPARAPGRRP
jgi:hypothetical protein